jgi:signal transduction histidine kinase
MLNIINNIVDISKIESGLMKVDIKEFNLNEKIEFVYNFFKSEVEGKGVEISLRNSPGIRNVVTKTDPEKLYSILINLVKNAIKYTIKGSIELGYEIKGKYLEFFVKDTGIGIPVNRQQAIFERFIQADITANRVYQGAGLGLSISKAYVEMLGGKLWVESEEGKGSVFYFTLPHNN